MFPISCASFGLCFDFNVNLISFFIICTRLSLFGSTYITLMAQNSKTIRIIFLPKCTQKNCAFYAAFYMFFLRISVLSGKTKSAKVMTFSEYFHINWPWRVSPLFNSAKIRTKGAIGLLNYFLQKFSSPLSHFYPLYTKYSLYDIIILDYFAKEELLCVA